MTDSPSLSPTDAQLEEEIWNEARAAHARCEEIAARVDPLAPGAWEDESPAEQLQWRYWAAVGALRAERAQNEQRQQEFDALLDKLQDEEGGLRENRDAWRALAREARQQRDKEAAKKQGVWDRLTEELAVERRTSQQLRDALQEVCDEMDATEGWYFRCLQPHSKSIENAHRALAAGVSLPPTEEST